MENCKRNFIELLQRLIKASTTVTLWGERRGKNAGCAESSKWKGLEKVSQYHPSFYVPDRSAPEATQVSSYQSGALYGERLQEHLGACIRPPHAQTMQKPSISWFYWKGNILVTYAVITFILEVCSVLVIVNSAKTNINVSKDHPLLFSGKAEIISVLLEYTLVWWIKHELWIWRLCLKNDLFPCVEVVWV